MNKAVVGLNVLLVVAVGYLLIDRFSGGEAPAEVEVTTNDTTSTAPDPLIIDAATTAFPKEGAVIAYIDIDSVSNSYQMITDLNTELTAERKSIQGRVDAKVKAFQDELETLQRKASLGGMTENEMMAAQQDMAAKEQEILQYRETKLGELMEREAGLQEMLIRRLRAFVKTYSEENGVDYVLGYTEFGGQVLYGEQRFDITAYVISGLNSEYVAARNQAEGAAVGGNGE